jgi:hypothetical protein
MAKKLSSFFYLFFIYHPGKEKRNSRPLHFLSLGDVVYFLHFFVNHLISLPIKILYKENLKVRKDLCRRQERPSTCPKYWKQKDHIGGGAEFLPSIDPAKP